MPLLEMFGREGGGTTPQAIEASKSLASLGGFCRRMGMEAREGEVGLVIGDEYFAIRDFAED